MCWWLSTTVLLTRLYHVVFRHHSGSPHSLSLFSPHSAHAMTQGLNHAGALRCATSGNVITRNPAGCSPDTYGDATTFMGGGSDLQLPNVYKYKVGVGCLFVWGGGVEVCCVYFWGGRVQPTRCVVLSC